jgi:copper chaperone CopZ
MHVQLCRAHVVAVLLLSIAGCADSPASAVFNAAQAPTVEFDLPDMMCEDGCAQAVEDILQRQAGVKEVQVNFAGRTAMVVIDEVAFDSQQALAALIDKGFDNSKLAGDANQAPPSQSPPEAEPQPAAAQ